MANIIFAEQENVFLAPPKMRQRLQSAPEKLLKSETAKTITTPLSSNRKAFGLVNKKISTPAVGAQEKKLLKPQEAKATPAPQTKTEEYPDIEQFIPYDPLEFEKYSFPEDLIPLSGLALPGLACFPQTLPDQCEDDLDEISPLPNPSPLKMPKHSDLMGTKEVYLCMEANFQQFSEFRRILSERGTNKPSLIVLENDRLELEAFLQTLDELTIELPPESPHDF